MSVRLKRRVEINGGIVEPTDVGRVATGVEAEKVFPNMEFKKDPQQVAVIFNNLPPFIVHKSQLDYTDEYVDSANKQRSG